MVEQKTYRSNATITSKLTDHKPQIKHFKLIASASTLRKQFSPKKPKIPQHIVTEQKTTYSNRNRRTKILPK